MDGPLFLFAPGAGAPSSHPWMNHWVRLLRKIGKVRTLDYPYMIQKRKRPDRLPVLIAAHRAALARARMSHRGAIVLIGKEHGLTDRLPRGLARQGAFRRMLGLSALRSR